MRRRVDGVPAVMPRPFPKDSEIASGSYSSSASDIHAAGTLEETGGRVEAEDGAARRLRGRELRRARVLFPRRRPWSIRCDRSIENYSGDYAPKYAGCAGGDAVV